MDRLTELFVRQELLQRHAYGITNADFPMNPEAQMEYVRTSALAAVAEIVEVLGEIGWKPWATDRSFNADAVISECVDVFHFLINIMLASGMPPKHIADVFFEKYVDKNTRNAQRQVDGYDGVSLKCPHCDRALDDVGVQQDRVLNELVFTCLGCNKGIDPNVILKLPEFQRIVRIAQILNTAT